MIGIEQQWKVIEKTLDSLAANTKTLCKENAETRVITAKEYREAHEYVGSHSAPSSISAR